MTGWMFLAFAISIATALTGGICIGAQWVRDDMAAQQRFADELERRRKVLQFTYTASCADQRRGLRAVDDGDDR